MLLPNKLAITEQNQRINIVAYAKGFVCIWLFFFAALLWGALFSEQAKVQDLVIFAVILLATAMLFSWQKTEIDLANKRVISKRCFFYRQVEQVQPLQQLQSVELFIGSGNSYRGIVSLCFKTQKILVVGLDVYPGHKKDLEQAQACLQHQLSTFLNQS